MVSKKLDAATLEGGPAPRSFEHNGFHVWSDHSGSAAVRFVGRGPAAEVDGLLRALGEPTLAPAWAKQVHSARVLEAVPGFCGEGDALVTRQRSLALAVVTADCVPVLLVGSDGSSSASGSPVAAVHAGWRGLATGILARAVNKIGGTPDRLVAWLGPAIGPCCYEVGHEVAAPVAEASGGADGLVTPGPRGRPHLDLQAAAHRQLLAAGVTEVRTIRVCTRCHENELFSYRRQGPGGGRNVSLIWAS